MSSYVDPNMHPHESGETDLLFAHFWGPGRQNHHRGGDLYGVTFHHSRDGLSWQELPDRTRFRPAVGTILRDPVIKQDPRDGSYRLAWTSDWNGCRFGTALSRDLLTWVDVRVVDIMLDHDPVNTWAPKLLWDSERDSWHVFFTSSLIHGQKPRIGNRFWFTRTEDFVEFSDPELLFDWGFGVNDMSMYRLPDDRYAMFYKCLIDHDIRLTFAPSPLGPWDHDDRPLTPDGVFSEGPTVIRIGEYFHLYHDRSRDQRMGCVRSPRLIQGAWEDVTDGVDLPPQTKHGSVLAVEPEVMARLIDGGSSQSTSS